MATSLIKPEDQEALPSYVQSIQSSENHPVASWESVKKFITEDPIVKNLTLLYRQRLQVSKSFADELKPKCPAITISAQMDGYGRKLTNFLKPTLKLMVEFDTVPGDQMEHIKQLIVKDEQPWWCIAASAAGVSIYSASIRLLTTRTSPSSTSST